MEYEFQSDSDCVYVIAAIKSFLPFIFIYFFIFFFFLAQYPLMKPCTALKKIKYIQQGGTFYTAYEL